MFNFYDTSHSDVIRDTNMKSALLDSLGSYQYSFKKQKNKNEFAAGNCRERTEKNAHTKESVETRMWLKYTPFACATI